MTSRWTFTATADGIVTAALEIDFSTPLTEITNAMTKLAQIAADEAKQPRPLLHREPL